MNHPKGFIEPCAPSKVDRPPSGPKWVHEIKHDGYRLMVRRDGSRVRCFTRNGHDWTDRFPSIVEAAHSFRAKSFLIDGEAVIFGDDGRRISVGCEAGAGARCAVRLRPDGTRRCRSARAAAAERKRRLARLIGNSKQWRAIQYVEYLKGDGPAVFAHVCRMGLEGIVSKRLDASYRSGPVKTWLKSKNPASEAVRRESEEDWS